MTQLGMSKKMSDVDPACADMAEIINMDLSPKEMRQKVRACGYHIMIRCHACQNLEKDHLNVISSHTTRFFMAMSSALSMRTRGNTTSKYKSWTFKISFLSAIGIRVGYFYKTILSTIFF